MTESQWFACRQPRTMLEFLRPRASARRLRLFGCACCRQLWSLIEVEPCRHAIEVGERFALGQASEAERARAATGAHPHRDHDPICSAAWRCAILHHDDVQNANMIATLAALTAHNNTEAAAQTVLLREIFGNPFRPVSIDPTWLSWQAGTVVRIARRVRDEGRWEDLPILADALEEAGCNVPGLLEHFRQPGLHVLGCWALDLVSGDDASSLPPPS
ncbi:MAG: hypothetical protein AB7K24_13405 [Gemmataceae bacterium]